MIVSGEKKTTMIFKGGDCQYYYRDKDDKQILDSLSLKRRYTSYTFNQFSQLTNYHDH